MKVRGKMRFYLLFVLCILNTFILIGMILSKGLNWSYLDLDFDSLTAQQLMEYLTWPNRTACERMFDFGGSVIHFPTMLGMFDGQKAICLDPEIAPRLNNCLVYSFGINNEWSFDEEMESYGCQVFAFDPSMNVKHHNHSKGIHFYRIGLGARDELRRDWKKSQTSLGIKSKRPWQMKTLSSIYAMLSPLHGENALIDYLKVDVEADEWDALPQVIDSGILDRVRQMGMEIHLSGNDRSLDQYREEVKMVRRLETETNMVRFDSKVNHQAKTEFRKLNNLTGHYAFELAWYNSKLYGVSPESFHPLINAESVEQRQKDKKEQEESPSLTNKSEENVEVKPDQQLDQEYRKKSKKPVMLLRPKRNYKQKEIKWTNY